MPWTEILVLLLVGWQLRALARVLDGEPDDPEETLAKYRECNLRFSKMIIVACTILLVVRLTMMWMS